MKQASDDRGIMTRDEHQRQRIHDFLIGCMVVLAVEGAAAVFYFLR